MACPGPDLQRRRSLRLDDYDYSRSGAYFVTMCTQRRERLFGDVVDGRLVLSAYGAVVETEWRRSRAVRREIELGSFVVMPDHFHGLVIHHGHHREPPAREGLAPRSIGALVAGFKAAVTTRVNQMRGSPGRPVWQRNYHEHIVRDAADYRRIVAYIADNPRRWIERYGRSR